MRRRPGARDGLDIRRDRVGPWAAIRSSRANAARQSHLLRAMIPRLHHAQVPAVLDHSRTVPQGDGRAGAASRENVSSVLSPKSPPSTKGWSVSFAYVSNRATSSWRHDMTRTSGQHRLHDRIVWKLL